MVKLLQWVTRTAGLLALILGLLIGRLSYDWVPRTHVMLGLLVLIALFVIAIYGFFAGLPVMLPLVALVWIAVTLYVAVQQIHLLTGDTHWIVQVVHALLGIGAIGLAEAIGARISRQRA